MSVFWLTECLPVGMTALFPVFLFPVFEIVPSSEIASQYVNDANMLFIGGLLMAAAVEYWQIHKRIALKMLRGVGAEPKWLMLGMMLATWFLSMWISNTAATAMMIPVVEAILKRLKESEIENKIFSPSLGDLTTSATAVMSVEEGSPKTSIESLTTVTARITEEYKESEFPSVLLKEETAADVGPEVEDENYVNFGKAISLSICYSATCGGVANLTGTDPNLVLKSFTDAIYSSRNLNNPVTFSTWFAYGFPMSVVMMVITWAWLQVTYLSYSDIGNEKYYKMRMKKVKKILDDEYDALGSMVFGQILIIILFVSLVLLWMTRDMGGEMGWGHMFYPPVKEGAVAIFVAVLLFGLPATPPWGKAPQRTAADPDKNLDKNNSHKRDKKKGNLVIRPLLTWSIANERVPWQIFFLLGGGYALSRGCERSGLSLWVGQQLETLGEFNQWGILIIICYVTAAATEVTSNNTIATLLLPILGQLALNTGAHPLYYMLPCTFACSFAFMLPVATPPNAIVFAYGRVKITDMARTGLALNILSVPCLVAMTGTIGNIVFDFDEVPEAFLNRTLTEVFFEHE
ncbi:Na(+)/citrate cotransporter-like [Physella acuta]|uniref:Na(+)/citrate cotransporter-like n=1 Tax=Physella acuta TaxID=109671 RepID=UPI0027DC926B|nr:Na(+)/citrate cotransporter-like [Physella acuta]